VDVLKATQSHRRQDHQTLACMKDANTNSTVHTTDDRMVSPRQIVGHIQADTITIAELIACAIVPWRS
jgi:hypothetical protein